MCAFLPDGIRKDLVEDQEEKEAAEEDLAEERLRDSRREWNGHRARRSQEEGAQSGQIARQRAEGDVQRTDDQAAGELRHTNALFRIRRSFACFSSRDANGI